MPNVLTYGDMNCLRAAKNAYDSDLAWKPPSAFAGNAAKLLAAGFVAKLATGGFSITPAGISAHARFPKTKAERAAIARGRAAHISKIPPPSKGD